MEDALKISDKLQNFLFFIEWLVLVQVLPLRLFWWFPKFLILRLFCLNSVSNQNCHLNLVVLRIGSLYRQIEHCNLLQHFNISMVLWCESHFYRRYRINYLQVQYGEDSHGFFETQIATTLDVDCPKWLDWFHGGLQFQTAHHLFPRMPRHNLRKLQTRLLKFCAQHGKPYYMFTFVEANKKLLKGENNLSVNVFETAEKIVTALLLAIKNILK